MSSLVMDVKILRQHWDGGEVEKIDLVSECLADFMILEYQIIYGDDWKVWKEKV